MHTKYITKSVLTITLLITKYTLWERLANLILIVYKISLFTRKFPITSIGRGSHLQTSRTYAIPEIKENPWYFPQTKVNLQNISE